MVTQTEFENAFTRLQLPVEAPVIVHASLSSFKEVEQGETTLLQAILTVFAKVIMPAFTYKTMITPETGPDENGMNYGSQGDLNRMAIEFHRDMPVDKGLGRLAEALRALPYSDRSKHPILSFSGVQMADALSMQTLVEPLAPIDWLVAHKGWVILLGVDHSTNTSFHWAEHLVGRKGFLRWARGKDKIIPCPGFPGCSNGFNQAEEKLNSISRKVVLGKGLIRAFPLLPMITILTTQLRKSPNDLLCSDSSCLRCRDNQPH